MIFGDVFQDGLRRITTNFSQELEVQISRFEPGTF